MSCNKKHREKMKPNIEDVLMYAYKSPQCMRANFINMRPNFNWTNKKIQDSKYLKESYNTKLIKLFKVSLYC